MHSSASGSHMKTFADTSGTSAPLVPFPEGWYFVETRRNIEKKRLLRQTWMGEEIVVWCNDSGEVCVAESVCPHLGSDLGPDAGAVVRDGCLVCPFHGFQYDVSGQCVATPFAPPPRSARLRTFETREISGIIYAWWGHDDRPAHWHLPEEPPAAGWSGLEVWSVRFVGHPQEAVENSVDFGHLQYVHGYGNVTKVGTPYVDGVYFNSCFDFTRAQKIAGINCFKYDVSAVVHVYGLGYSYVEVVERAIDMQTRLWVLATPIDGRLIQLTLASQIRNMAKPRKPIVGMRFLPVRLRTMIMNKIVIAAQRHDVLQDVTVWGRKRYRERPFLCSSDGEIGLFRQYCHQFYPRTDAEDAVR